MVAEEVVMVVLAEGSTTKKIIHHIYVEQLRSKIFFQLVHYTRLQGGVKFS